MSLRTAAAAFFDPELGYAGKLNPLKVNAEVMLAQIRKRASDARVDEIAELAASLDSKAVLAAVRAKYAGLLMSGVTVATSFVRTVDLGNALHEAMRMDLDEDNDYPYLYQAVVRDIFAGVEHRDAEG